VHCSLFGGIAFGKDKFMVLSLVVFGRCYKELFAVAGLYFFCNSFFGYIFTILIYSLCRKIRSVLCKKPPQILQLHEFVTSGISFQAALSIL
jgi:hypothetical protein